MNEQIFQWTNEHACLFLTLLNHVTYFGFQLPWLNKPGWRWRMGHSVLLLCSYLGAMESREQAESVNEGTDRVSSPCSCTPSVLHPLWLQMQLNNLRQLTLAGVRACGVHLFLNLLLCGSQGNLCCLCSCSWQWVREHSYYIASHWQEAHSPLCQPRCLQVSSFWAFIFVGIF